MVPEGWQQTRLDGHISIKHGFAFSSEFFGPFGKDVLLTPGNFNEEGGFRPLGKKQKRYDGPVPNNFVLSPGDMLVAMTEQAPGLLGSTLFVPEGARYLHNQRLGLIEAAKDSLVDLQYLHCLMSTPAIRRQISSEAGGTKVKHTSPGKIVAIEVALPPLPEQRKIADILSTWDRAIETTEALLATARTQKRALMQSLLTGKRRFPEFQGQEWKEVRLGDVLKEVKRPVDWSDNDLYRLISVRRRSGGLFHRDDLYGCDIKTKTLKNAAAGDFLISKMQVLHGAMGLVRNEFDGMQISGSYIAVVSKAPNVLKIEFFDWVSRLPRMYHQAYLCSYGVHIEKMTFNFALFLREKISVPPTAEEQSRIVEALEAAETEESGLVDQIEKLRSEKKALMQQLLTGKRRVVV